MLIPAALYALVNARGAGSAGWGIPMATDIAFALGVLALLGRGIPPGLRVFLAALAIVDDIGAVLVIALFYAGGISVGPLVAAGVLLGLAIFANRAGVRSPWAYGVIGLALWGAVFASGVHATVAGVLLAMTSPARTRIDERSFLDRAREALAGFEQSRDEGRPMLTNRAHQNALYHLQHLTDAAQSPLARLEHGLHGVVAFVIMPLFALANAGVSLGGVGTELARNPVVLGIVLGLVIGKPLGISLISWLAVRMGFAQLPDGVTWKGLHGVAALAGIGFTMSLFISGLAFRNAELLQAAKLGILGASLVAGMVGWLLLRGLRADETRVQE
jgi:NhaA family Na+:H+ antiporter